MNVQGRRGGISCDNKGERLIHKKKKWLVAGTAAEQRRPLRCGDRSDPRRTTSGAGLGSPASVAPAIGNASGGGGRKPNPTRRPRGRRSCTLAQGWKKTRVPREGSGSAQEPLSKRPEHCSPRARGLGTHACARAHTQIHRHTHRCIHKQARSALPLTLPPAPAAHPPICPASTPDPAGRQSRARQRMHTNSYAPRNPGRLRTPARAGTPAHADPRAAGAQSSLRSAVFFMNENVVCK